MLSLFRRQTPSRFLTTDIHSHLLPGIDDGSKSVDESLAIINHLAGLGFTRIVTTPHIMTGYFENTYASVREQQAAFEKEMKERNIQLTFEAAAEYYLDEVVHQLLVDKQPLLTFGDRYLLFETNVISEPFHLKEFIFQATVQGYRPILAHPERYQYMSVEKAEDLRNRGVLLQINTLSLIGYYGPPIQRMAEKLIDKGHVDLLGSDCHHMDHAMALGKAMASRYFRKAILLPIQNNNV